MADSRRGLQFSAKCAGGIKYQLGHGGDWGEGHLLVSGRCWGCWELVFVQESKINVDTVSKRIIKTRRGRVCEDGIHDGVVHGEGKVNVMVIHREAEKGIVVAADRPDWKEIHQEAVTRCVFYELENVVGHNTDIVRGRERRREGGGGNFVVEVHGEGDGDLLLQGNGAAGRFEEVGLE